MLAAFKNKSVLISACNLLIHWGAEAIVLGGADVFLAFDDISIPISVIDCAEVHNKHPAELAAQYGKL